jgi:hypothetical protein
MEKSKHPSSRVAHIAIGAIVGAILGLAIGMTMSHFAMQRMRPALYKEYCQIQDEIYSKYLSDGMLPAATALSASAQKTLSEHKEIRYTVADGLSYMYDKPCPTNIPFMGLLTFGFCWGGEAGCGGIDQRPEYLIHNARLRAKKPH